MTFRHLISFLVFFSKCFLLPHCSANPFPSKASAPLLTSIEHFSFYLTESRLDLPRLCVHADDPSQYYPCVLNYIGLNSWSLYRCPNYSTFDEQTQQCLQKIPISDNFEQLASTPSISNVQFYRLASFILHRSTSNEDHELQQRRLVSLPPIFDQFIDSLAKKSPSETVGRRSLTMRLLQRSEIFFQRMKRDLPDPSSAGVIWSHGYPLMRLDSRPILEQMPTINSRSLQFPSTNHHPVAVSEGESSFSLSDIHHLSFSMCR